MENEYNNLNNINPKQYIGKLNELSGGIDVLLDEFKRIYVIAKMHPTDSDSQQQFQNVITSLNTIQSKMFSISNTVQLNIDDLNKKLLELNKLIDKEREKNKDLKKKLGFIEHTNNSSTEMIHNYKEIYNINYLRNWALFLSSIFVIMTIKVVYKKQGV